MKKKIKVLLFAAALLSAFFICIRYPSDVGSAAKNAFLRCTDIMIPSMFIFMCLSCIASSSGITEKLIRPLRPLYGSLFRLNPKEFSIFLLSLVSGYPAGIKLIYDALDRKEISGLSADRLCCFCFSSGPAFIFGVSAVLFPDTQAGLLMFLSVTSGNIFTAFLTGLKKQVSDFRRHTENTSVSADCIVNSVAGAASAMLKMCTMIIFFSGITEMLRISGLSGLFSDITAVISGTDFSAAEAYTNAFLEISSIVSVPSAGFRKIPVISSMLSFGGICVILQLISISGNRLPLKKFILSRIFAAAFSWFSCRILMSIFDFGLYSDVFSCRFTAEENYSPVPSVFLVIMSLLLISALKKSGHKSNKMI
ncbi:MAG: hypothetical protein ACI4I9_07155 [Porcipelethomonas sp.]